MSSKVPSKAPKRPRGRPPGRTAEGEATRERLYAIACAHLAERGYAGATLRGIADAAGVSPGLLYRYFPNKQAIVLALYDDRSARFAADVRLPAGPWRQRFEAALDASLAALTPDRATLAALVPVLVGDRDQGLFAPGTAFSRERVEAVFRDAVAGATDAPRAPAALARALYTLHLGVVLFWLLDASDAQRATTDLRALLRQGLTPLSLALKLPGAHRVVTRLADALTAGLLGPAGASGEPV